MNIKPAFTLAEVLIVLGIIGLIADMTIPTLHQQFSEKVIVTQTKKAFSTFENALRLAIIDNGTPDEWGIANSDNEGVRAKIILDTLAPYMRFSKNCGNDSGCLGNSNHDEEKLYAKGILSDGSSFFIRAERKDCSGGYGTSIALKSACAYVAVDVNGAKKPNRTGYDMFYFYITKYGLVPFGSQQETNYTFENSCRDSVSYGCAAWVIYNENQDYLRCKDLAWGKTTCN